VASGLLLPALGLDLSSGRLDVEEVVNPVAQEAVVFPEASVEELPDDTVAGAHKGRGLGAWEEPVGTVPAAPQDSVHVHAERRVGAVLNLGVVEHPRVEVGVVG
jgi:hypothetical protein